MGTSRKRSASPVVNRKQKKAAVGKVDSVPSSPLSPSNPRPLKQHFLSPFFFVSIFLDLLCPALVVPLLHLYIDHLHVPKSAHGIYQALYGVMQTIGTPILGTLSDHVGRRPVLVLSLLGTSVAYYLLLFSVYSKSILFFVISRLVIGAVRQTMSTGAALVAERYGDGEPNPDKKEAAIANGLSLFQSSASFGFVVGPGLGGYLADQYGILVVTAMAASINVFNAVIMYVTTAPLPRLTAKGNKPSDEDDGGRDKEEANSPTGMRTGSGGSSSQPKKARSNPVVLTYTILSGGGAEAALLAGMYFYSLSYVLIQSSLTIMVKDAFELPPTYSGMIISCASGLKSAVGAFGLPILLKFIAPRTVMVCCMWVSFVGYFLQTFSAQWTVFCGLCMCISAFSGMADTLMKSRFSMQFSTDRGGEVMSIVYSIDGCNRIVGPLLASFLIHYFDEIALVPVAASSASALVSCVLVTFLSQ